MNALEKLAPAQFVTPAETGDQGQFLFLGLGRGLEDGTDARRVGGHGFFAEDMLAGLDGGFEVLRTESRRGCQQDHVHAAVDHFLVGVQARKAMIGIDMDAIAEVWLGGFALLGAGFCFNALRLF